MPNLILLDLKMPKIDGIQVLQILPSRFAADDSSRFPPVVVLTSSDLDDDITEAYRLGAQKLYTQNPSLTRSSPAPYAKRSSTGLA